MVAGGDVKAGRVPGANLAGGVVGRVPKVLPAGGGPKGCVPVKSAWGMAVVWANTGDTPKIIPKAKTIRV